MARPTFDGKKKQIYIEHGIKQMRPPTGSNVSKNWKMEFEPMVKAHEQQGSNLDLVLD